MLADKLGLPVEDIVTNLFSAEGSQLRTPLDDMDDPIEAAKTFVEVQLEDAEVKLAPELRTPEKALAAAREVVAQRLAVEPEVRRQARQHFETHAIYVVKPTSKGRDEVDQAHPYFRVRSEFHGRTRSLIEMRPGPAPYDEQSTPGIMREKAEPLLLARKAEDEGYFTVDLKMPPSIGDVTPFLETLKACYLSPTEGETAEAWNKERTMVLERVVNQLLFPHFANECKEAALREATAALVAHCSFTLRRIALAPPYRVAAEHRTEVKAEQEQRARGKKKKQEEEKPWFPSKLGQKFDERTGTYTEAGVPADYWPRQARAVGARLCYDERNQPELVLAALDSDGQLLDWCKVRWLHVNIRGRPGEPLRAPKEDCERKRVELKQLEDFFTDVGAEVVVLGGCALICRRLRDELEHVAFAAAPRAAAPANADEETKDRLVEKFHQAASPYPREGESILEFKQSSGGPPWYIHREQIEGPNREALPFRVHIVDEQLPQLWASSPAAVAAMPDLEPELRTAVSTARMAQDPLSELVHIGARGGCPLATLPLHPLIGEAADDDVERALALEVVDAICARGFELRRALLHPHHAHGLQYVPGLGPRKAAALLKALQSMASNGEGAIEGRDQLRGLLPPAVWHNAVGFFKFTNEATSPEPPGLEGARIHPEVYEYAQKMCFDALQDDNVEVDETPAALEQAVIDAMSPDGTVALGQLDLGEYAEYLASDEGGKKPFMLQTLIDVRAQLASPFADLRGEWVPLAAETEFQLLVGEPKHEIEGSLQPAKVTRIDRPDEPGRSIRVHVMLQNGLSGTIDEDQVSSSYRSGSETRSRLRRGWR